MERIALEVAREASGRGQSFVLAVAMFQTVFTAANDRRGERGQEAVDAERRQDPRHEEEDQGIHHEVEETECDQDEREGGS
jgi:hypothetical protein